MTRNITVKAGRSSSESTASVAAKHVFYIIDGCYSGFLDLAVYATLQSSRRSNGSEKQTQFAEISRLLLLETVLKVS